jgi:hypothetical protein
MKLYFWTKLERTTGRVGSWKPGLATDAQATGLFGDSVEGVYFSTVLSGQTEQFIRQRFQAEIGWLAMECRYEKYTVVTISETDYFAFQRKYAEQRLEAMGVTQAAIERIKANDLSVIDRAYAACSSDEFAEIATLIEQLTANFKEAK